MTTEYEVLHASPCDYFSRSRLRTKSLIHIRKRDREPSRIPVKKLVNLMRKNRKRRCKIKILIKRLIPKSSAWHNLLSTQYRKNAFRRQTNEWRFWKCPCCTIKSKKMHGAHKRVKLSKLNRRKILSTSSKSSKCDIQRMTSCDKYSLFVCGDIELNPGPVNTLISILTTRLAQIELQPVNIVGDGNCFFRSVSHQLNQTETYHAQIRALAIQHLINSPEHFIESNTDQSWMQYIYKTCRG